MTRLLHIEGSPRGDESYSSRLAHGFLDSYRERNPDHEVEVLNVWTADLPPFEGVGAGGKYKIMAGKEHTPEEKRVWDSVDRTIDHFKSADKILISSPMWNFGIPWKLKYYVDIIVQPGRTFSFTPEKGYEGLVTGKPAQLILSRGGSYPEGAPVDFQRPYLELFLKFIGFTDIRVQTVEPTLRAPDDVQKAVAAASDALRPAALEF
jgi:FMN-dependent NADH-azoreductase